MPKHKRKRARQQPDGTRSASGRKRDRSQAPITPCDGVIRRRATHAVTSEVTGADGKVRTKLIETETCDAIGRAWTAGLLGDEPRATELRDMARKIAAAYWVAFGFMTPDSLARFQPSQPGSPVDDERAQRRENWLNGILDRIPRAERAAFDALVIDINPDAGPAWLDAVIYAKREGKPMPSGVGALNRAVDVLGGVI